MVNRTILDNGIRVVTEQIAHAHSVCIGVWIVSGSRHEDNHHAGISHFIEHMLLKGTTRRSAQQIAKQVDALGGPLNAFTGREYSCFHLRTLPDTLEVAIKLLADLLLDSVFAGEEVEKERRVILQELQQLDESPEEKIHDLFSRQFWPDSALGRPVLGTIESVLSLQRDDLLDYSRNNYVNSSLILCVTGPVNHQHLLDLVSRCFQRLVVHCPLAAPVCAHSVRAVQLTPSKQGTAHICLGTEALSQTHPNRFAVMVLNEILGGGMNSRLFQSLRERQGLVYTTYSYLNCYMDCGALVCYAATPSAHIETVVEAMLNELRSLRDNTISDEELRAVRERLQGRLFMSLDSSYSRMERLALGEIYHGGMLPIKKVMRELAKVSADNLRKLAEYLICDDRLCLTVIGDVDASAEKLQNIQL